MPKASPLKRVNGRLTSAKSKTGNPACSEAMSVWVRTRKAGSTPSSVFAMLGKCRAQARQNKQAQAKQDAGKLAPGRGTWQRSERTRELLAARAAKQGGTHTPTAMMKVAPVSGGYGTGPAPSVRERIAMRKVANDLTGETRKRAATKLRKSRAKLREATRDPGTHTDHAPGSVVNLKTELIHFDPTRFQYKLAQTDTKTGAVGSLAGVKKFDPELAGTIQVWKDPADGKTYVVNGHNRMDLAKKLGAGRISARFLEADTPEQARAKGAITNIAEGRGTALDAAKFFRDTGHTRESLESRGVPLREKIATDGLALSNLENGLFRRVVDGSIPQERAAIIGGSGLPHEQQKALVDLVDKLPKNREVNNATLRELTDTVKAAGSKTTKTHSLFGDDEEEQSLALHRATLQSQIKQRLSREKKLFGTVAKSKAAEDLARAGNQINTAESGKISHEAAIALGGFDALKNRSGPVSRALNEASERIAKGENSRKVTDETYRRIVKDLPEMLAGRDVFSG